MLRIVVGIDTDSHIKSEEVSELLACYYRREEFRVIAVPQNKNETECVKKCHLLSNKLRSEFPHVELCVGVAGGNAQFPNPANGVLVDYHSEYAIYIGKDFGKKSEEPHCIILEPDLSVIFGESIRIFQERFGISEKTSAPKSKNPVHSLVNCARMALGEWEDETKLPKQ